MIGILASWYPYCPILPRSSIRTFTDAARPGLDWLPKPAVGGSGLQRQKEIMRRHGSMGAAVKWPCRCECVPPWLAHICNLPVSLTMLLQVALLRHDIGNIGTGSSACTAAPAPAAEEECSKATCPCDLATLHKLLQRLWSGRCGKLPSDCSVAPRALLVLA